jgi:DNA-binding NarL/FixJ family response regulator
MSDTPIRVLSVDDHAFLVEGLRTRLDIEKDIELVGHLETAEGLVDEVRRTGADIVLIDIEMPGPDTFEALDDLRRRSPDTRAILLSAYLRDHYIDAAYQAGAWGYLLKSDSPEDVVDGIRNVFRGELAFSPRIRERSTPPPGAGKGGTASRPGGVRSKLGLLTTREQQILRMIAKGMSRIEIADEICRSPMTVDNHRKSIMKKLEINDRAELVRYAISEGLVV